MYEELKRDVLELDGIIANTIDNQIIKVRDGFDNISNFIQSSFLETKNSSFSNVYSFANSYASSFFNKLVGRLLSALFKAMPEIKSNDRDILEIYKKDSNKLEAILRIAIKNYIVYGYSFFEFDSDNEFRINNSCEIKIYSESLFSVLGVLDSSSVLKLKNRGINTPQDKDNLEAEIFYFKNKRFIKNEQTYLELDSNVFLQNGLFIYEKPIVNLAFEEFYTLDNLHKNYLKTLAGLKTNAITFKTMELEAKKALSENFSLVTLNVSNNWQNKDVASLLQWMDNKPLNETIKIQGQEIQSLKEKIIEICDLQDLFSKFDNSSETRVAAQNRVATANLAIESKQKKVNNFIENFVKNYMGAKLKKNVLEVELELDSVSILQIEAENLKKEQDLQKVIQLIDVATNSSPAKSNMYFQILKQVINVSSLDKNLIKGVEAIEQEYLSNLENSANSEPTIDVQMEIQKRQAEINKINAEAEKINLETKLLPKELNFKIEEQMQQNMQEQRLQNQTKE